MRYKFEGDLSIDDVQGFINQHELEERPRLQKLYNYYIGKHAILNRKYEPHKPQARIVHNFASYITNQSTAYFLGVPISYTSSDDKTMEILQKILDYNDEADTNSIHAENMSIYGKSYELLYVDKDQEIDTRFVVIDPREMFLIYDYSLDPQIIAAVRYYYHDINQMKVELYQSDIITYYSGSPQGLQMDGAVDHFFKDVPATIYINNNAEQGDFEPVLDIIDTYNEVNSDTANDLAYFSDAYLFLAGASITEEEADNMKANKIINVDDPAATAQFLVKNINDTALENYKKRLEKDIHKFSAVPSLDDESFAGNLSGVAIKYKIIGLENQAAMKERKFKKGLQRRFELIYNLFYTRGLSAQDNYLDVYPTFKRSLPSNLLDEADVATKLNGIISDETLLDMLSIVEDPAVEIQKILEEQDNGSPFIGEAYTDKALEGLEKEEKITE